MVTESYMLARPAPPSPLRTAFNQRAIPALIDTAASVERGLERLAVAARQAPIICLLTAFAGGWLAASIAARHSRKSML